MVGGKTGLFFVDREGKLIQV